MAAVTSRFTHTDRHTEHNAKFHLDLQNHESFSPTTLHVFCPRTVNFAVKKICKCQTIKFTNAKEVTFYN